MNKKYFKIEKLKSTYKISSIFFLLSLMFIPFFNNFPWLQNLSVSFRSPSYFFLVLMFLAYIIESLLKKKFIIKVEYFLFLIILFLIVYNNLTFFINYSLTGNINNLDGYTRMYHVILSTNFKYILLLFIIHYINLLPASRIKKYIEYGFLISMSYVIVEIICFLFETNMLMNNIEYLFHDRLNDWGERARGLAFEPSYQSVVLMFLLPFIVNKKAYLYMFLIALISTFSMTGFVALFYFCIFYWFKGFKLFFINILIIIYLSFLYLFFNEYIDFSTMHSTTTRIGSWVASLRLIIDNLLFGVGPGMSGYWLIFNYTDFFYLSVENASWTEQGKNNFGAPSFAAILTFILDYGFIPILLLIFYFIKNKLFLYIHNNTIARASIAGLFISSFGIDSYNFIGFYVFLAITISKKWHLFDVDNGMRLNK